MRVQRGINPDDSWQVWLCFFPSRNISCLTFFWWNVAQRTFVMQACTNFSALFISYTSTGYFPIWKKHNVHWKKGKKNIEDLNKDESNLYLLSYHVSWTIHCCCNNICKVKRAVHCSGQSDRANLTHVSCDVNVTCHPW